jgi:hypothetical protein
LQQLASLPATRRDFCADAGRPKPIRQRHLVVLVQAQDDNLWLMLRSTFDFV